MPGGTITVGRSSRQSQPGDDVQTTEEAPVDEDEVGMMDANKRPGQGSPGPRARAPRVHGVFFMARPTSSCDKPREYSVNENTDGDHRC